MPIVIVVGVLSVPTTIMPLERVVCPTLARVGAGYRNSLSSKAQRPHIRRVCVVDSRFDGRRKLRLRSCLNSRNRLWNDILHLRIAFYSRDVRTASQGLGDLAGALHQDRIHDVERTMLDAMFAQPSEHSSLCCLALVP